MSGTENQQPSLVGGHAEYVKGAAEVSSSLSLCLCPIIRFMSNPESARFPPPQFIIQTTAKRTLVMNIHSHHPQATIGNITGSQAWKASGEQAKAHAVSDMKAASEGRDPSSQGYGKAEEIAGKAVGCEGMVKEGDASAKKD